MSAQCLAQTSPVLLTVEFDPEIRSALVMSCLRYNMGGQWVYRLHSTTQLIVKIVYPVLCESCSEFTNVYSIMYL